MSRQVSQSPFFQRQKKRLAKADVAVLDDEVRRICAAPEIGETKKGDLAGVSVYKFKVRDRLFILACEFDEYEVLLIALSAHENFYRDLERYWS